MARLLRARHDRPVRISLGDESDLAVTPGTRVKDISDSARALGIPLGPVTWCGDVALDPLHPAGTWPLVEGARLTSVPGLPCAPSRGPTLLVVAGPDAGARVSFGDEGIVVGRGSAAGLSIGDPAVSRAHVHIRGGEAFTASDLGSANGTRRWRGKRDTVVGRRAKVEGGDFLSIGSSLVSVLSSRDDRPTGEPHPERITPLPQDAANLSTRLTPLLGSVVGGLVIAMATGRWYLAIVGLTYPLIVVATTFSPHLRRRIPPLDISLLPSLLPSSREAWEKDAPRYLAITGPRRESLGCARAVALTLGRRPRTPEWSESWMRWLGDPAPSDPEILLLEGGAIPSWCDASIETSLTGCTLRRAGRTIELPPMVVEECRADALARSLAGDSTREALPQRLRWADIASDTPARWDGGRRRLIVPLGAAPRGTFSLDLDAHGPHILVAGMTGSGKSGLLETLILGLARLYPPSSLTMALIDFKGGAGIRACVGLPHVCGVLTDLDPHLARRALGALAREIEDRKSALAAAEFGSFHEWEVAGGAPPRLLVIADEYQELVAHYREFVPDLARLAAQGRSLGLHLVLATQRPSGAVTPEIRANVGTTIALRVTSDAESRDLVGTPDAAWIPLDAPGRAIVVTGGERSTIQVALPSAIPTPPVRVWGEEDDISGATRDMADGATRRWGAEPLPRSLWLDPLPFDLDEGIHPQPGDESETHRVSATERERNDVLWLGRADLPSERRQPDVGWNPRSGPLIIAGPPGSGRTTALRLLAHQASGHGLRPVWMPSDPREAARTITLTGRTPGVLLLVDDAQRVFSSLMDVDRGAPAEALLSLLASGAPIALALPLGGPHRLATHTGARLVFTGGESVDDAAWSVPRHLHGIPPAPGRARFGTGGLWSECQVGRVSTTANVPLVAPLPLLLPPEDLDARLQTTGLGTLCGSAFAIGIGGDDASPVMIDPSHPVLVIAPPGAARDATEASLNAAAVRFGVVVEVQTTSSAIVPPRDTVIPTIIVAEPTLRTAREAFRGELDGLIDPRPTPGRVLVVSGGSAVVAQLTLPKG